MNPSDPQKPQKTEEKPQLDESILYKEATCQVCGQISEYKVNELQICGSCKQDFLKNYEIIRQELKYDQMLSIIEKLKKQTKYLSELIPKELKPSIKETWNATNSQEKWVNKIANTITTRALEKTKQEK